MPTLPHILQPRPVSTATFGPAPEGRFLAPHHAERQPSVHRQNNDDSIERPTLIRSQTPQPGVGREQQDIAKMFSENMFSDPPATKHWGIGPKLLTDGHQRLIMLLREECGRLFSFNRSLKDKIVNLEREKKHLQESVTDLRSVCSSRAEKVAQLAEELRDAQEQLSEMDATLNAARNKRRSRIVSQGLGESVVYAGENAI